MTPKPKCQIQKKQTNANAIETPFPSDAIKASVHNRFHPSSPLSK